MTDGEPDDRVLLAAHVAGDPGAFGQLFARHRDRLWAVALRTTGDPEDAADALQDAMVAAFRRADSFRGDAAVTTWLHRVVVNACLDRLRRNKVRAADPLPEEPDEIAGRTSAGPAAGVDPVEAAERSERREVVLTALRQLSADQRAALVLVDMEGYSIEEAAAILEVPTGTVKSRCSRGRTRLLPLLAELTRDAPPAPNPPAANPPGSQPGSQPGSHGSGPSGNRGIGSHVPPVGSHRQGPSPGGGAP